MWLIRPSPSGSLPTTSSPATSGVSSNGIPSVKTEKDPQKPLISSSASSPSNLATNPALSSNSSASSSSSAASVTHSSVSNNLSTYSSAVSSNSTSASLVNKPSVSSPALIDSPESKKPHVTEAAQPNGVQKDLPQTNNTLPSPSTSDTKAKELINANRIRERIIQLISIQSYTGQERKCVELVRGWLESIKGVEVEYWNHSLKLLEYDKDFPGKEVDRESLPVLCARVVGRRGNGPKILFSTHIDVAPVGDNTQWNFDPFRGEQIKEQIYGRGACASKSALVSALEVFEQLSAERDFSGELFFLVQPGGEDGNSGALAAIRRGLKPDHVIIAKPTFNVGIAAEAARRRKRGLLGLEDLDLVNLANTAQPSTISEGVEAPSVVIGQAGYASFKIALKGKRGYGGLPGEGESALGHYLAIHQSLLRLEKEMNEKENHPLMKETGIPYPLNIGAVHGGDWSNSVMDLLIVEGRVGIPLGETIDSVKERMIKGIEDVCKKDEWLSTHPPKVELSGYRYRSFILPDWETSALVDAISKVTERRYGARPRPIVSPVGSDLFLWSNLVGCKVCVFGPGDARLSHAANESVNLQQVAQVTEIFLETAKELFNPSLTASQRGSRARSRPTANNNSQRSGWFSSLIHDILTV